MLFPDIIGDRREPDPDYTVRVDKLGQNVATRYRKSVFPRWAFGLAWDLLSPAEAGQIDDHVKAAAGSAFAFGWFDWRPLYWLWVPIARADGSTATFDLPGKGVADASFYAGAGTSLTGTVTAGVGADGRDRVTFSANPAAGMVWMNGTMRRWFSMNFETDTQPLDRDPDTGFYRFSTKLVQEKNRDGI